MLLRSSIPAASNVENQFADARKAAVRIERGMREEAEAHDQEREKARRIAQELLAGWEKQQADRSKIKQSARVMGESWPFAPEHFKPTTPLRM